MPRLIVFMVETDDELTPTKTDGGHIEGPSEAIENMRDALQGVLRIEAADELTSTEYEALDDAIAPEVD